jgi:hypothetical protein
MSFMLNLVICGKPCHSCQIMAFGSNHGIRVKSCHSCQIMAFVSNHGIHVKACHSCHASVVLFLLAFYKVVGWPKAKLHCNVQRRRTSRCPYCAIGFHCEVLWMGPLWSLFSALNHVIHVKLCQIMSFSSNHVIQFKSCHSCQIMSFMSNHVIHVKSCHSCQIMSFMSYHVNSFMTCVIRTFQAKIQ